MNGHIFVVVHKVFELCNHRSWCIFLSRKESESLILNFRLFHFQLAVFSLSLSCRRSLEATMFPPESSRYSTVGDCSRRSEESCPTHNLPIFKSLSRLWGELGRRGRGFIIITGPGGRAPPFSASADLLACRMGNDRRSPPQPSPRSAIYRSRIEAADRPEKAQITIFSHSESGSPLLRRCGSSKGVGSRTWQCSQLPSWPVCQEWGKILDFDLFCDNSFRMKQ